MINNEKNKESLFDININSVGSEKVFIYQNILANILLI